MKKSEALTKLASAGRMAGHARTTRQTYSGWVGDYCECLKSGAATDFQTYLDHLADKRKVCPATVKQALNALVFFHRRVLDTDPGILNVPMCRSSRRVPVFLTHPECLAVIAGLHTRIDRLTILPPPNTIQFPKTA